VDSLFAFRMVFSAVLSVCVLGVSCTYRGPKARWAGDAHASTASPMLGCRVCSSMYDPHCATVRALTARNELFNGQYRRKYIEFQADQPPASGPRAAL